jgi:23S rRNA (uracil1939-C5)-methyltransferase/tRNA (uracil-5-)-methyltransferase
MATRKFNDRPFSYHQEIELEIATLTNLGSGLARVTLPGSALERWVVMVPFALPGEKVRARIFRNHRNFSEADLVEVLVPSPDRVAAPCPVFGRCGGCQYQNLAYSAQLTWKQRQVAELLEHMAGITFAVEPVIGSPQPYGYRSKITPHFDVRTGPNAGPGPSPIGFLRQGTRHSLVDVPRCPIATEAINARLAEVRAEVHAGMAAGSYQRGATLLFRDAAGTVTTDFDAIITEEIALPAFGREPARRLRLRFIARDFFQNNPFILPAFVDYVRRQAAEAGARFLVDAYCGSGLFALGSAPGFERVAGVEISASSVAFARENAAGNGITNADFLAGQAEAIFSGLTFPGGETAVVIDPPRAGCDEAFLRQLLAFAPAAVIYVSCDPGTQMRDLRHFLSAGYRPTRVQPFDLFPQTRHLECVITLRRD